MGEPPALGRRRGRRTQRRADARRRPRIADASTSSTPGHQLWIRSWKPDPRIASVQTMSSASSAGHARQQIEIGDEQAGRIGNPVGNGDDDVLKTVAPAFSHEARAQRVLVAGAAVSDAPLVGAERLGQEARLAQQPLGAGRWPRRGPRRQALGRAALRSGRPAAIAAAAGRRSAAFGDEAGTQRNGRSPASEAASAAAAWASASRSNAVSRRGGRSRRACSAS